MKMKKKVNDFFFSKNDFSFQFFFISFHFIKSNYYQMIKMFFLLFFVIDFDLKNICLIYFKIKTNNLNLICQYRFDHVICQRCAFQNNRCDFVKYSFSKKKQKLFQKKIFVVFAFSERIFEK